MAAPQYTLPPPAPLDIHDTNAADKWKKFKRAWTNYSLATELNKKSQPIQVATLLTVIGEEARKVFSTFTDWTDEGDDAKIVPVLAKFEAYASRGKTYHLRDIGSTAGGRKPANHTTNTERHYECLQKVAIFRQSPQTKSFETALCSESEMTKLERDYLGKVPLLSAKRMRYVEQLRA